MKKIIFAVSALSMVLATACAKTPSTPNYKLTMTGDESLNGQRAYITNYDTGEPVDSIVIADGVVEFSGSVEQPLIGRLVLGGKRGPIFLLEAGNITVDSAGDAVGTPLNDALTAYGKRVKAIQDEYRTLSSDSAGKARAARLQADYGVITDSLVEANSDNALGMLMLLQSIYDLDAKGIDSLVARYPMMAGSSRVAAYRESLKRVEATSEGRKFTDFEIEYNGKTSRLSDYVGKGRYVLVDFWASWCGPCIREIKVLKELYKKYADKGLDIVGVAVWDEPANTEGAIKRLSIPWPNIINAQSVPTDLYGISGIPCIILFGPDGTIISRGKQDAELIADVEAAMNPAAAQDAE